MPDFSVRLHIVGVQPETFDIMNLLDDSLKVSNSAVVLAATKCFLNLTADLPEIRAQARASTAFVYLRPPLL